MQKTVLKKGIAFIVIFLFVGVSAIPSTSTIVEKKSNILILNEGSLSGYVNDTSMNPIEGARVRVCFHGTYEENFSDSSGYYHVTNIPICNCTKNCTAFKEGYKSECVWLGIYKNTTYDFVLTHGNTLYVGGSGLNNYTKIQDAIDNASDGDTVFVYNGTYVENVVVNKSIELLGEDRNTTIIDGNRSGSAVNITAEEVTINSFTVQNGECSEDGGGILARGFNSTRIINNIIFNNSILGINLDDGFGYIIERNVFISNVIGIECCSSYSAISYNFFINNDKGVKVWGDHNIISYNNFRGCDSTSIMFGGSDNILTENTINGSGRGIIYPWGEIHAPSGGVRTIISNNTIINFDGEYISGISLYFEPRDNIIVGNVIKGYSAGISLQGRFDTFVDNTIISGNILQDNGDGIYLLSCRKTNISGNILQNNAHGIYLLQCWKNSVSYNKIMDNNEFGIWFYQSNFNKVFKNNFMNNGKNAHLSWLSLKNGWKGNFWDKERESPYPIIGCINPGAVIKIPWVNFDWHPAQEPYEIGG